MCYEKTFSTENISVVVATSLKKTKKNSNKNPTLQLLQL